MKITEAAALKSMFTFLALHIIVGVFLIANHGTQTEFQFSITLITLFATIAGFVASFTALSIIGDKR